MSKPNLYKYNGKLYTLKEITEMYGIKPYTFLNRIRNNGWSVEKAIETKPRKFNRYLYKGQYYTTGQLAKLHGDLSPHAIRMRLEKGMTVEQIMAMPKQSGGIPYSVNPKVKKEPPKKVVSSWQPHRSAEDIKKCKKCRYSEKDSGGYTLCAYIILHSPPERRNCEPGKNCIRFEPRTRKSDRVKMAGSGWIREAR